MIPEARTLPIAPTDRPPPPALKPPVPPRRAAAPRSCWRGRSGSGSRPTPSVSRGRVPRPHAGRPSTRSPTSPSCSRRSRAWCSEDFIADAEAGFERAPMSVRVSPYLLSLIDWTQPVRGSAAHPVHPARLAPAARPPDAGPRLAARARGRAGAGADPPLPRQGAVPGARHLPGLLPLLHAQLRRRRRHRGGREGPPARSTPSAGSAPSSTSPRGPSSRTSSSPAATPTSCAPSRSPRSARRCSRSPTSAASASPPRARR